MSPENGSAHITDDQVRRWRSRELAPDEILAVTSHIGQCAVCRDALTMPYSAEIVARSMERYLWEGVDWPHCGHQELAGWVDGTLSSAERQAVAAHLELCDLCRTEAADFESFAATLPDRGDRSNPAKTRRRVLPWGALAAGLIVVVGIRLWHDGRETRLPSNSEESTQRPYLPTGEAATPRPMSVLRDGPLVVTASGTIEGLSGPWQEMVKQAIDRPTLTVPAFMISLVRGPERQRGREAAVPEVVPVAPSSRVVLDERPRFEWTGKDRGRYRVEVYDPSFIRIAASARLVGRSWTPGTPLPSGKELTWRIIVERDGEQVSFPEPPHPLAVFVVATPETRQQVAAARKTGSRLVTGVVLWRTGLLDEAAAEFESLARENPLSEVANSLATSSARGAVAVREISRPAVQP